MNFKNQHIALGLGLLLGASTLACGSSKSDPPATGAGGTAAPATGAGGAAGAGATPVGPPGTIGTTNGTCATSQIQIAFNPMFSAFDGIHIFQVPAIVDGLAANAVTWSASDMTMVAMQIDPTTGGVMIETKKPGVVDIIATAGTICGSAKLTISEAVSDDWESGNLRYNNGTDLIRPARMGRGDGGADDRDGGGNGRGDGGNGRGDGGRGDGGGGNTVGVIGIGADGGATTDARCTNCHGPTASMGPFKTVSHTPEQIGGFSDEQLKGIFNGMWPTGSGNPFDTTIVSQRDWERFHKWNMTDDQAAGVIIYLRALTPAPQMGSRNFGGRGPGGGRGDGGMRPPTVVDAAAPTD